MEKQVLGTLISWLIICSIFLILVFLFVKILFSVRYEKRIKDFALDNKTGDDLSIADAFLRFCLNTIKLISKSLNKSHVLNDYAQHFEKYLSYQDNWSLQEYLMLKQEYQLK